MKTLGSFEEHDLLSVMTEIMDTLHRMERAGIPIKKSLDTKPTILDKPKRLRSSHYSAIEGRD